MLQLYKSSLLQNMYSKRYDKSKLLLLKPLYRFEATDPLFTQNIVTVS